MTLSEQLDQLDELHRRGVLTDEEFERAKANTLAQPALGAKGSASAVLNSLHRSPDDRWLGGVCGGLAQTLGVASWICRLGLLLLVLCAGTGVLLYILMWIFLPLGPSVPQISRDNTSLHAG
jgi:phage shock protein PspC (stress-responsive transcriptional regulator)